VKRVDLRSTAERAWGLGLIRLLCSTDVSLMRVSVVQLCARSLGRRGFTAVEALVAVTILAILTAAVSGALAAGRAQSKLARDTVAASFLAHSLMDEISRLPFDDPEGCTTMGPDSGEAGRGSFDNVDDYYGYADGPGNVADGQGRLHPISDFAGNAYPDAYQGFRRTVTMTAVSATPSGWNRTVNGLLVTVAVSRDGVELIKLQRVAWD
jgi:prepilin-type N-terminal cleavage/methylation domain-containing protein